MPDYTLDSAGPAKGHDNGAPNGPLIRHAAPLSEPAAPERYGTPRLKPGDVLSNRFVIDRLAGSGGMGTVYRALDRVTGQAVALKVARRDLHEERFAREARVLAELDHPAIVRYVAHGETTQGQSLPRDGVAARGRPRRSAWPCRVSRSARASTSCGERPRGWRRPTIGASFTVTSSRAT